MDIYIYMEESNYEQMTRKHNVMGDILSKPRYEGED